MIKIIISILFFFQIFPYCAQEILGKLTLEKKITQLIFIRVENDGKESNFKKALELVANFQVGGVCFLQHGTIESCFHRIEILQAASQIPQLICQDFEWGLSMRLKNALNFPSAMTLGAIEDNKLIYDMAKEIGRQCKLLGVHINFAPVADINSNFNNPIIGFRSFSDDPKVVAEKTKAFMHGLHDAGVIACAKHFPGHGDTEIDSHLTLPVIKHPVDRIEQFELFPFKALIDAGIQMIMSAHIHVPAIDNRPNRSITLSHNGITRLLKEKLNFSGLVITDDLIMGAISKHFKSGEIELEAFLAGNDILLMPSDIAITIATFKDAIKKNIISIEDLNARVLKVLKLKEKLGLFSKKSEKINFTDFHTDYAKELKQKLYESAVTLIKDEQNILPILKLSGTIAHLQINGPENSEFNKFLKQNLPDLEYFFLPHESVDSKNLNVILPVRRSLGEVGSEGVGEVEGRHTIIISLFEINKWRSLDFNIPQDILKLINNLKNKKIILVIFQNGRCLSLFKSYKTIIMAYEPDIDAQLAAGKVILGQIKAKGKLPIQI